MASGTVKDMPAGTMFDTLIGNHFWQAGYDVTTKRVISTLVKVAISASLFGFLFWRVRDDPSFWGLAGRPKDWRVLLSALPVGLLAVPLMVLRWQMFLRTLGLAFTLRDVLRAGFLGYAYNLIPVG